MTNNFRISSPPSVDEMLNLVRDMRDVLDALAHKNVPSDEYTIGDLDLYCRSLIAGQRGSLGRTIPDSWSVAEHDDGMPADARVDFVFLPTYIAVATLTRVIVDHPAIAASIPGFEEGLRRGMVFATHRRFEGHGYDATRGMIDAALIFAEGGVAEFLSGRPDFCPELLAILRDLKQDLASRISSGNTTGAWGEDYESDFLAVLDTLRLLPIPGMEQSIKSGMETPPRRNQKGDRVASWLSSSPRKRRWTPKTSSLQDRPTKQRN